MNFKPYIVVLLLLLDIYRVNWKSRELLLYIDWEENTQVFMIWRKKNAHENVYVAIDAYVKG